MIIYVYYWKALWSPRFVNFMNLCAAIALLDIFSVLRGPFKHDEVGMGSKDRVKTQNCIKTV